MADIQQEFGIHALNFTIHDVKSDIYYLNNEYTEYTNDKDMEHIVSYLFKLQLSDFTKSDKKKADKRFYSEVLTHKGLINLYHTGKGYNKDTVHIEMKGSAFDSAELNITDDDINRIVSCIVKPEIPWPYGKANVTDIHIYVDDKQQLLNFDQLQKLAVEHSVRTQCSLVAFPGAKDTDARSLVFGARPKRYSIYESGRHRYRKEDSANKGIDSDFLDYIRVELQLSGEHAAAALGRYAAGESLTSIHGAYFSDAITFLLPSCQKNKARWKTLPAWAQFLSAAGDAPYKPPRKPPTEGGHTAQLALYIRKLEELYGPRFVANQLQHHIVELDKKCIEF
ncbi:MAG: replication initiation factor domain-containing protein [Desulfuromonadales bacterium]|nr:replication initiation factor domain-containing protein [Desulfuromonadales bacterium]